MNALAQEPEEKRLRATEGKPGSPSFPSSPGSPPVTLTQSQREAFLHFIEYHPPKRFSRNLRKMLLEYLMIDGAKPV